MFESVRMMVRLSSSEMSLTILKDMFAILCLGE
jgi:hypothetical protein